LSSVWLAPIALERGHRCGEAIGREVQVADLKQFRQPLRQRFEQHPGRVAPASRCADDPGLDPLGFPDPRAPRPRFGSERCTASMRRFIVGESQAVDSAPSRCLPVRGAGSPAFDAHRNDPVVPGPAACARQSDWHPTTDRDRLKVDVVYIRLDQKKIILDIVYMANETRDCGRPAGTVHSRVDAASNSAPWLEPDASTARISHCFTRSLAGVWPVEPVEPFDALASSGSMGGLLLPASTVATMDGVFRPSGRPSLFRSRLSGHEPGLNP
jgi:hypothetical protein